jgi:hypothetical protein
MMIKSRRMRLSGYVARMREMRNACRFSIVDGRIIFKCVLNKKIGSVWVRLIWLVIGVGGGGALVNMAMNLRVHKVWTIS